MQIVKETVRHDGRIGCDVGAYDPAP
jgi:hypothetical protein